MTSASLAGPFGWKAAWRFKGRLALSAVSVATGVAIGYAVHLINASAVDAFARGVRALSGTADLTVRGSRTGLPLDVFVRLASDSMVAAASPALEFEARVGAQGRPISIVGLDALRAAAIAPALIGESADQLDALRDDTIFISARLAAELRLQVGDLLVITVDGATHQLRVAGWLNTQAPEAMPAIVDIAAAQAILGRYDRVSRVDVRLRDGIAAAQAMVRLQAQFGATASIEQPHQVEQASARLSRAYRVNLTVLALMALFTGALLVFASEALMNSRRRTELALLRVLGMTRADVLFRLLRQAAVVGLAGALTGLLLGALTARLVLHFVGGDLGAGYFHGAIQEMSFAATPALAFGLCGIGAALLGALLPAVDAARVAPASGLKASADLLAPSGVRSASLRWYAAGGFVVLAALLVQLPPMLELPLGGYGAIACVLFAALVSLPAACTGVLRLVPGVPGFALWLGTTRLRRAPLEVSMSLAAMVAAVSLTVSMAIMVGSFRDSLLQWLDRLLPADLYLRATTASNDPRLSPQDQARIAALAGVRAVEFLRVDHVNLEPTRPRVVLLARDVDRNTIAERLPLLESTAIPANAIPIWPSEVAAGTYGLRVGQTMALPLAAARPTKPSSPADADSSVHSPQVFIAGIWRDYGRPQGAIVIERAQYIALTGERAADDAALWFEQPDDAGRVTDALGWLGEQVRITTPGEIKRLSVRIFDRTFAVTYALEAIAVLIGIAGLSAGISASVAVRQREFGMLRHFGASRRQLVMLLISEGLVLCSVGAFVGTLTGALLSWILIEVVNRQSFHWGMDMHVPVGALLGFVALLLGVAVLAAATSARQVMQREVVRAVRDDW